MRLIDADALREKLIALNYHTRAENMNEACVRAVDYAPTVGGWVSVKDRLPEEETEYLCWFGDYPMGAFAMVCRWNKTRGAFWCYSHNAKWAFVTHWMPLPETPKEVQK